MKTKIIANYLPQYHRIPENDRWWGEGAYLASDTFTKYAYLEALKYAIDTYGS